MNLLEHKLIYGGDEELKILAKQLTALIVAALNQPNPTPELEKALEDLG